MWGIHLVSVRGGCCSCDGEALTLNSQPFIGEAAVSSFHLKLLVLHESPTDMLVLTGGYKPSLVGDMSVWLHQSGHPFAHYSSCHRVMRHCLSGADGIGRVHCARPCQGGRERPRRVLGDTQIQGKPVVCQMLKLKMELSNTTRGSRRTYTWYIL